MIAGVEVALIEALASGVPVAATRTASVEEIAPPKKPDCSWSPTLSREALRAALDVMRAGGPRGAPAPRESAPWRYSADAAAARFREFLRSRALPEALARSPRSPGGARASRGCRVSMRVLHVDPARTWRGGERQVLLLAQRLAVDGVRACWPSTRERRARATRRGHAGLPTVAFRARGDVDPIAVARGIRLLREVRPGVLHSAHRARARSRRPRRALRAGFHPILVTRQWNLPVRGPFGRLKYRHLADHYVAISGAVERALLEAGVESARITRGPQRGGAGPGKSRARARRAVAAIGRRGIHGSERPLLDLGAHAAPRVLPPKPAAVRFVWAGRRGTPAHDGGCSGRRLGGDWVELPGLLEDRRRFGGRRRLAFCLRHSGPLGDRELLWTPWRGDPDRSRRVVGELPEIVRHDREGLLAERYGDAAGLAAALAVVSRDRARARWAKRVGFRSLEFDVSETARRTRELLRSPLSREPGDESAPNSALLAATGVFPRFPRIWSGTPWGRDAIRPVVVPRRLDADGSFRTANRLARASAAATAAAARRSRCSSARGDARGVLDRLRRRRRGSRDDGGGSGVRRISGHEVPRFITHRGEEQRVLLEVLQGVRTARRCSWTCHGSVAPSGGFEQRQQAAIARTSSSSSIATLASRRATRTGEESRLTCRAPARAETNCPHSYYLRTLPLETVRDVMIDNRHEPWKNYPLKVARVRGARPSRCPPASSTAGVVGPVVPRGQASSPRRARAHGLDHRRRAPDPGEDAHEDRGRGGDRFVDRELQAHRKGSKKRPHSARG